MSPRDKLLDSLWEAVAALSHAGNLQHKVAAALLGAMKAEDLPARKIKSLELQLAGAIADREYMATGLRQATAEIDRLKRPATARDIAARLSA